MEKIFLKLGTLIFLSVGSPAYFLCAPRTITPPQKNQGNDESGGITERMDHAEEAINRFFVPVLLELTAGYANTTLATSESPYLASDWDIQTISDVPLIVDTGVYVTENSASFWYFLTDRVSGIIVTSISVSIDREDLNAPFMPMTILQGVVDQSALQDPLSRLRNLAAGARRVFAERRIGVE